jgi:WD40 repeat protein
MVHDGDVLPPGSTVPSGQYSRDAYHDYKFNVETATTPFPSVELTPANRIIVLVYERTLQLSNLATRRLVFSIENPPAGPFRNTPRYTSCPHVDFRQNGKTFAVYERWGWMDSSRMGDGSKIDGIINQDNRMPIGLWEVQAGTQPADIARQPDRLTIAKFSVDERALASVSCTGTIRTWLTKSGALQHTLNGHTDAVIDVGISHSSHILGYSSQSNR